MTVKKLLRKAILNVKCHYAKMVFVSFYAILCTGCGKKIQNTTKDENQKLPLYSSSYEIRAKRTMSGVSKNGKVTINSDAWITIPEKLTVLKGNGGNQLSRLYFNVADGIAEFYCDYRAGASSNNPIGPDEIARGKAYTLEGCFEDVDGDGVPEVLNYTSGTEVPHDSMNQIVLEVLGADDRQDNETQASFDVEPI